MAVRTLRMQMGFVFQSFNLFSNMTALRNVTEGLTVARGMDKADLTTLIGSLDCYNQYGECVRRLAQA